MRFGSCESIRTSRFPSPRRVALRGRSARGAYGSAWLERHTGIESASGAPR